jgi:lyso-ornithine lipid O-acyltransferase
LTWLRLRRAVALLFALAVNILHSWLMRLQGPFTLERRALWLKAASRRVLKALGLAVEVDGQPPARGLVLANHLSYLDILILSAAMPCFFVSKIEVDSWPYFGWAARTGGTIFLDRKSMRSARTVAGEIAARLDLPVPVLLFPEGTSTDGTQVQRFHSRFIDPAIKAGAPITTAAIRYAAAGDVAERELCWYGGAEFLPHVWKVMNLEGFSAQVRFGEPRVYADRHVAAERTHAEVAEWRESRLLVHQ